MEFGSAFWWFRIAAILLVTQVQQSTEKEEVPLNLPKSVYIYSPFVKYKNANKAKNKKTKNKEKIKPNKIHEQKNHNFLFTGEHAIIWS